MRLSNLLAVFAFAGTLSAAPQINEIMFHPVGTLEDPAKEWIELYNPATLASDISGYRFTRGISYTIPPGTSIPAGGYLIVAANPATFLADHPGFSGAVVGGWTGRLSNSGEEIQLDDVLGDKVTDVTYADEGDWALRARGPLSFAHRGWIWESAADGSGRTLEVRNPALSIESGQNWGASQSIAGTPGAVNSLHATNLAPLIRDAKHRPEIPSSTDPIVISCDVQDEAAGAVATLRWRVGTGNFQTAAMADTDGDGDVEATILPPGNLAIVEWYISVTDGVNSRTWPAPARTSDPGVVPETFAQVTNALLQVDDSYNPAATFMTPADQPIYRMILTAAERDELVQIQTTAGQEDSEATFNATFISHDGTGLKTRYGCGVRNRGQASALGPPNNYHVSFPSSDRWNGRAAFGINCQYVYSQALGQALFDRAGLATQEAAIVRVRLNGVNMAEAGNRMFGRYVRIEGRGGDWAENHYPDDPDGNFYRLDDHAYPQNDPRSGEFRWEGPLATSYSDTFLKETNKDANDYSDLMNFCRVVSAPITGGTVEQPAISDAAYPAAVSAVLDLDNFYRFIAADALLGNQEGGLQTGRADDVSIYRGVVDPRFRFIPHDLDDVFDIGAGVGDANTRSILTYDTTNGGVAGLTRLFNHPQLIPRYYAAVIDATNTWFNRATIDPIIDQIMAGWVPATDGSSASPNRGIAEIKNYVDVRRANVLSQIQQNYSLAVTGNAPDSAEGYKVTTTGAATLNGTFNVARTYSVTVNGQLAQWFYRTAGADVAGTWKMVVPAGGGTVLRPGLNYVTVNFWDQPNGTGNILQSYTALILNQPAAPTYTNVSGTLTPPGTLTMTVPSDYIPGIPVLVRLDLKDPNGNLDRTAWNRTATLTASNGVTFSPSAVTLTNGMGSALVTIGGGGGGGSQTIFSYGVYPATPGSTWKYKTDLTSATIGTVPASWKNEGFDDSSWSSGASQIGYGDNPRDEQTLVTRVDYDGDGGNGTQSGPSYLFRNTFNIASVAALASVTGEVKFDDSCVVYVNGTQVFRHADLTANAPLTEYTETTTATTRENATAALNIPLNLLHDGTNTIAVEVHQHDAGSSDATFDLRLQANFPASDPGNFTLTAAVGPLNASKAITSLGSPTMTNVSGALPAGTTNWSGLINVTGDVTVPVGGTLNIAPGTLVLVNGTAFGSGGSGGADIIVAGTLNAIGTAAAPISITCSNASNRWGEINFPAGAGASTLQYCLVSRACHSPGGGHTGTGPMVRLNGTTITIDDSVLSDSPGKTMTNNGNCNITIRRTHFARGVMGPELDGSALTLEDSNLTEMLPANRESGAADDEDCIYIHDSGGRPVNIRRTVLSNCGDDALDCLAGSLTVEDSIIRNAFDKGASLLNNNVTMRRVQLIDNDIGVSTKCQVGAAESTPFLNVFENCTIVSENHPTNTSDGDFHSVGIHTRNKYGTTTMNITVQVKNCIVSAEEPVANDYGTAGTPFPLMNFTYTNLQDLGGVIPNNPVPTGTGNIGVDPLYVSFAADDYHLQAGSPCRDTGDPASPLDTDGSRADMGVFAFGSGAGGGGGGEVHWTAVGSPYRVTGNLTVPANLTLRIHPGVAVYFDQNVRMTINGRFMAEGTPGGRIVFSHVPGAVAVGDADPVKNGTQTGPPKWGGIRVYDSMAQENVVRYCDFINAQGTSPAGSENYGSIGFIRSWGWVDNCTWAGTHLRMCYGRNSKITVTYNVFPDMFIFDPVLNRIENPTDFVAAADNNQEPLKVEYPTTDPEVSGNPAYPNGQPAGGHWRCYFNDFYGNRGHNDVFDADSGRWNQAGQFLLDCRYNHFHGLSGDEHIDLGGDAYIASNIFEAATKDQWTSDTGYSNAISSGDKGSGTTIYVTRNLFFDLDHAINCKLNTATVFEHNTVANFHADFTYNGVSFGTPFTQDVKCAPINFFIPEDGSNPSYGDGAYMGYNLVSNVPRLFSGADARKVGGVLVNDITTKIEFFHNLVDQIGTTDIGPNHAGGIFNAAYGVNTAGTPDFVDAALKDFRLRAYSAARGAAPGGLDYGWSVPEWAYVIGGPVGSTAATTANFTVGGPGIVAYKWRIDGGAWSSPIQIGAGGIFPRTGATVRQATLSLTSLAPGAHTLEVLGQDVAGNWQDADPARNYDGLPQSTPTTRTWTVDQTTPLLRINEVLANGSVLPDTVEIYNAGTAPALLSGWFLTDNPTSTAKYALPAVSLAPGTYGTFSNATLTLDKDGDAVYLMQGVTVRDSVTFGSQLPDMTIGRHEDGNSLVWRLGASTLGAANSAVRTDGLAGIRLSEWFASGDVLYRDDWLEISNSSSFPVDLGGLRITDNRAGQPNQFIVPPLTFIGANGFLKFIADGETEPRHLPFSLDSEQETLSLLSPTGELLDTVTFYPQTTDYSMSRDIAGTGFTFYELPTAGLANTTTNSNALALLHGLRVTEIMFNALGGSDYDFVELRNVGGTPFQLNGVSFVEGISFTFGSQILNPGENIIVAKNVAKFRLRYGDAPLVAGAFSGQLDNGGEPLALRLPPPFDANILTFDYNDTWYPGTDGDGLSIVVGAPLIVAARDWDERETWSASSLGGNPSGAAPRTDTYSGWMTLHHALLPSQDDDHDSVLALVEFGLGMNPASGLGYDGPLGLPDSSIDANGHLQISFLVPQNAAANNGHGFADTILRVDASDTLLGWTNIAAKSFAAPWTGSVSVGAPVNGYVPVTVTDANGPAGTKRYLRFRVEWLP